MEGPGLCPRVCRCPHGTAGCSASGTRGCDRAGSLASAKRRKKNGLRGIKAPSLFSALDPLHHEETGYQKGCPPAHVCAHRLLIHQLPQGTVQSTLWRAQNLAQIHFSLNVTPDHVITTLTFFPQSLRVPHHTKQTASCCHTTL